MINSEYLYVVAVFYLIEKNISLILYVSKISKILIKIWVKIVIISKKLWKTILQNIPGF